MDLGLTNNALSYSLQLAIYYFLKDRPISFEALFCPSSWATGLYEDVIKQNRGESQYSTRQDLNLGFLSDEKSDVLDRSDINTSITLINRDESSALTT
ncbi:hypothetical protein J6590_037869 [Homalodisca vitripennis]|nr:hypothetical protein J6590_037869 [Homalodisca vitripennis]